MDVQCLANVRICAVEFRNSLQLDVANDCLQNKGSLLFGHLKRIEESCRPRKCQKFNLLSANPRKWSNTLKQFFGKSRRIV